MHLAKLAARPSQTAPSADPEIDAMLDALFAHELHPTWQTQSGSTDSIDSAPSGEVTSAACGADTARAA